MLPDNAEDGCAIMARNKYHFFFLSLTIAGAGLVIFYLLASIFPVETRKEGHYDHLRTLAQDLSLKCDMPDFELDGTTYYIDYRFLTGSRMLHVFGRITPETLSAIEYAKNRLKTQLGTGHNPATMILDFPPNEIISSETIPEKMQQTLGLISDCREEGHPCLRWADEKEQWPIQMTALLKRHYLNIVILPSTRSFVLFMGTLNPRS
jgi:hypothetical protein